MTNKENADESVEACKIEAKKKGAGEEGAQRCDQSGSTGTVKPSEEKSKKDQENLLKNPHGMKGNTESGGKSK
jgi:hypothetical protein